MLNPGDVIGGRYRIVRALGSGGMGVVLQAHHLRLDCDVAIKVLHAADRQQPGLAKRFEREVKALAKVQHPNVARALDADALDDGSPYLVMEYLEGRTLKAELRERGALPPEEAAAYIVQACQGVAAAHAEGILHRDLKPPNLFLTQVGRRRILKVLDFGIAKFVQQETELTQSGVGIGTPLYMSPEQLSDASAISARSDVWALGVVLYELIAGVSPFAADSAGAVVAAVMLEQPVPLERLRPQLSRELAAVVHRCLSKDPAERFSSARALGKALEAFVVEPDVTSVSIKIPVAEPARLPSNHPDLAVAIERKVDSFKPASLRSEAATVIDGARRIPSLATLAEQVQSMRRAESHTKDTRVEARPFSSRPAKSESPQQPPKRRAGLYSALGAALLAAGLLMVWRSTGEQATPPVAARLPSTELPRPADSVASPSSNAAPNQAIATPTSTPSPLPSVAPRAQLPRAASRASSPTPTPTADPIQKAPDGKPLHL